MIHYPHRVPKSESGYYPAGALSDPNAPYNQVDEEFYCKECGQVIQDADDSDFLWWCDNCQEEVYVKSDIEQEQDRQEAALEDKLERMQEDRLREDD